MIVFFPCSFIIALKLANLFSDPDCQFKLNL